VLVEVLGSKVRAAILLCLVKASKLGISVTPRSIARVFGVNFTETYKFMKNLLGQEFVEKTPRGFKLTEKGLKLVDFTLTLIPSPKSWSSSELDWVRKNIPDTLYYISRPHTQTWFGPAPLLLVVDKRLQDRIVFPENFVLIGDYVESSKYIVRGQITNILVLYASLRGREYKYSWDNYLTWGSLEQSYADLLSYMPFWEEFLPDILLNSKLFDLDKLFKKASEKGKKRLATGIAYYATLTGWKPILKTPLYSLVDERVIGRVISITPYLLDSSVLVSRNI